MFKTVIIGYCKYLKNKHWMQFMELSAIEANGIQNQFWSDPYGAASSW